MLETRLVAEITSGAQMFFCKPYSCKMLARACVERQAKADAGETAITLDKCNGCELGAEVKVRAVDVVLDLNRLLRNGQRAVHRTKKTRGARIKPDMSADERELLERPLEEPNDADEPESSEESDEAFDSEPPAPPSERQAPAAAAEASPENEGNMAAKKKKAGGDARVIDMTGQRLAGVRVLRPGDSKGKGASWVCEFPCKHTSEVLGAVLRAADKRGGECRCPECPSARSAGAEPAERKPRAVAPARAATSAPPPRRRLAAGAELAQAHQHTFPLRRDFTAAVELPSDLSKSDVTRLSRWLETLVFEDG